jgi:DNA-binding NarL/FixJ family response regulator
MDVLAVIAAPGTLPGAPPEAAQHGLSPRELEVLRLIAAGKSNREIAEDLFLSPRTVERHIANIYLKIDVHTKAEATAYARGQHLG